MILDNLTRIQIDHWLIHLLVTIFSILFYRFLFVKDWDFILYQAAQNGSLSQVTTALKNKAKVNIRNKKDSIPLHVAIINKHNDVAKLLIQAGSDLDLQDDYGRNTLFLVAQARNYELCELVLSYNININSYNYLGETPLLAACVEGDEEMIKLLLKYGADSKWKNLKGLSCIAVVIQSSYDTMKKLNIIRLLVEYHCNLESKSPGGWTPLIKCAFLGDKMLVEALVSHGANVNACADNGFTPLMAACQNGWLQAVELLLEHEADVNSQLDNGSTALIAACNGGYTEIVLLLVQNNALLDTKFRNGSTALMAATFQGYIDIVELLIKSGSSINACNEENWNALAIACEKGFSTIAKMLIESNCDVNVMNACGFTPLQYACQDDNLELSSLLIANDASVNPVPFQFGVDDLINKTKMKNAVSPWQWSGDIENRFSHIALGYLPPIMFAIGNNNAKLCQMLLDHNSELNINLLQVAPFMNLENPFITNQSFIDLKIRKHKKIPNNKKQKKLKSLIELVEGKDLQSIYLLYPTPLLFAIYVNNPEIVRIILKNSDGIKSLYETNFKVRFTCAFNLKSLKHSESLSFLCIPKLTERSLSLNLYQQPKFLIGTFSIPIVQLQPFPLQQNILDN
eukprot:gene13812-18526_t